MEVVAQVESSNIFRHDALIARYAVHMISRSIVLSHYSVKGKDSSKIALCSNLFDDSAKGQNPIRKSAYVAILNGDAEDVRGLPVDNSQDCFNTAGIAWRWWRAIVAPIVANDSSGNAEAIEIEGDVIRLNQDAAGVRRNHKVSNELIAAGARDFEREPASILNAGLIDQNGLVRTLVCREDLY